MGRKKKEKILPMGVTVMWIDKDGQPLYSEHVAISDEYRAMQGYGNCVKHLKRHQWEIIEGIKYKGYLQGKKGKGR